MAVEWIKATDEVIDIARELIGQYHPSLEDASIGFLFRSEAPISNGKATYGKAKKISEADAIFMDYDFIIWLAQDMWDRLTPAQKTALVDHELCHCHLGDDDKPKILPHDIEEFNCILQRHGFWWPSSHITVEAIQHSLLPLGERRGKVEAVTITATRHFDIESEQV